MLKSLNLRKYREILFIDSENVGYQLPQRIPRHTYIYLFVSQCTVLEKLNDQLHKHHKQVEIIDISLFIKQNHTKNAMDFCIVSKLGELIQKLSSQQKVIIVSKDKGYDVAIDFIKNQSSHLLIERYPLPVVCYYGEDTCIQKILDQLDNNLKKTISYHHTMLDLKKFLTKNQKKIFVIANYTEEISGIRIFIEYDIYLNQFSLFCSGTVKKIYQHLNEAQKDYQLLIIETKQRYQKYYSKELLNRAKQLNIHPYIEEAYLKNKPLQECLISHFGKKEGTQLFNCFVHV